MRNLNLRQKMALLVGVLVATIATVSLVGGLQAWRLNGQLQRMVHVTNRAVELTARVRVALLAAIRAEKNAVLASDDVVSRRFVGEAEVQSKEVDQVLPDLRDLITTLTITGERQDIDDFRQGWETFKRNQAEVLRIAVLKTNVRAKSLVNNEIRESVTTIQRLLGAVQRRLEQQATTPEAAADLEGVRRRGEIAKRGLL